MFSIIALETARDDFGVYASGTRSSFGTPLVFRGTLDECIAFTRSLA